MKVYTCEFGKGSNGRIERLDHSERILARGLPQAVDRAKQLARERHTRESANIVRILEDPGSGQRVMWVTYASWVCRTSDEEA